MDLEDESEPMMLPGTPARYLERLKLSAEIFGDDVQFLGVHVENLQVGRNLRIVTSQRHLEGNAPDWEVIEQWLVHLRFERVPGVSLGGYESQTWRQGNVWLFDVRPPNLVLVGNELVPIDIICQRT